MALKIFNKLDGNIVFNASELQISGNTVLRAFTGNTVLLGNTNQNLSGATYNNNSVVENLAILNQPSGGTSGDTILVRDSSTGIIKEINQSGLTGGGSSLTFNNGLTETGGTVSLGGTLTGDTKINTNGFGIAVGSPLASSVGVNSIALGNNVQACGKGAFAAGYKAEACTYSSVAIGAYAAASGYSAMSFGRGSVIGDLSMAFGGNIGVYGERSFAFGYGRICADRAFILSTNQNNDVRGTYSGIIGGRNNDIKSGNTFTTLIGGNNIDLTGNTYASHTVVSNLAIFNQPSGGTSGDTILVRDSTTGIIKQINQLGVGNTQLNLLDISGITTSTISDDNHVLIVDTSTSSQTVTLPSAPSDGLVFKIKDSGSAGINNITIDGNAKNIDGLSTATIDTNYGGYEIIYFAQNDAWYILSFNN